MIEILAPNTSFSIRLDFVCVCCCMVRMTSEQPLFHVTTHMDACVVLMAEHFIWIIHLNLQCLEVVKFNLFVQFKTRVKHFKNARIFHTFALLLLKGG